jgi:SpoVK/Ycf46/Vps4 family AAA+-type ATPase
VGGTSGESEERIRQIFESAAASAPSVLFIDAIDVIAGKKDVSLSSLFPSFYSTPDSLLTDTLFENLVGFSL